VVEYKGNKGNDNQFGQLAVDELPAVGNPFLPQLAQEAVLPKHVPAHCQQEKLHLQDKETFKNSSIWTRLCAGMAGILTRSSGTFFVPC
jgi:hypothetical protein